MRAFGITYDTGFVNGGHTTREHFAPELVRREMRVIRDELHCTAVRVTGGDPDRLELAARSAWDAGLRPWISPFTCGLSREELLRLLIDCAERAERLRRRGAEVVFLTGSEVSLFNPGFLPGDTLDERLALLADPGRLRQELPRLPDRVNAFLGEAVAEVRERFHGTIGYASLPFEGVDWAPFDVVATDGGYRSAEVADRFRDGIRALVAQGRALGKPVAVTEFGCTTHRGAADLGARGESIVEWERTGLPARLTGEYVRDEQEQAAYLLELMDLFTAEGVDCVFANTFARYDLPHRSSPDEDFDMASFGIVKVLEGDTDSTMPWEPKAAFTALATAYRDRPA
ncbi:hypothetical protein [Actinomadura sp. 7K507]|uniref:hypothetical protein n=1 Tax=Actinomadura sp. 7K507 TaxID=2530365 RepID=UPI00104BFD92|nr:hypothetical protein [Actinomadura sp. 7K507]TDC93572.1 hypothetical protein E1285_10045 [Actinomadura sp. 7K507]